MNKKIHPLLASPCMFVNENSLITSTPDLFFLYLERRRALKEKMKNNKHVAIQADCEWRSNQHAQCDDNGRPTWTLSWRRRLTNLSVVRTISSKLSIHRWFGGWRSLEAKSNYSFKANEFQNLFVSLFRATISTSLYFGMRKRPNSIPYSNVVPYKVLFHRPL